MPTGIVTQLSFMFEGADPINNTTTNSTGMKVQCSYKAIDIITQENLTISRGMVQFIFLFLSLSHSCSLVLNFLVFLVSRFRVIVFSFLMFVLITLLYHPCSL